MTRSISDGTSIQVLESTADLEALAPRWTELWQADPHATPLQHPAWLIPWWHHFSQPDLRLVTICRNDDLLGILPLYIYRDPASGERQLLLVGAGTSDYLDGIFSPRCTPDHLADTLDYLLEDRGWDVAHFTQLLPHSPLFHALERHRHGHLTPYPGELCSRCPAVPIADLPGKVRSDVRYFRNYAIGRGALTLTEATDLDCAPTFDLLVRFHTERWQRAGEPGVLADPAVLAWHREALPQLLAGGLLRLWALRLDGTIIAVLYALIDPPSRTPRTAFFYLMGFSLDHAELRPGTLLTALAVERAAAEGVQTIDMLRGQETYKQFWHTKPVPTFGFALRHNGQAKER